MDKPICRVCTKKHYSHEPHVFPESSGKKRVVLEESSAINETVWDNMRGKKAKIKFDRVAYQREYMRKRRAKP